MARGEHTGRKIAIGAAIAGLAGYVTGVLTAPKSGKQTRRDISDKASDVKDSAEEQLENAQDELKSLIKESKSKTITLKAKAREEFNEAVIKAKDAQDKAANVLKAVRRGEASDPDLNRAVKQAKQAQKNLLRYLKG